MTLPEDFRHLMQQQWGDEFARQLCQDIETSQPQVSFRLNPQKPAHNPVSLAPVPWCPNAYYVADRPPFTFDPLFHAGAYYVQEASSMFLAQVLLQYVSAPLSALDLCAAPGGKSTLLRSLLPEGSLLVCNEPIRQRAQVLSENMTKWGNSHTVVTQEYPDAFSPLHHFFDLIVADVPCSGEGMFRKDDEAVQEWSMQNVELCWQRQREIIRSVWPSLRPGGILVYSTCTFNAFEDEENVQWICRELGAEILPVAHPQEWGIVGEHHFFPGKTKGEGFFLAAVRKLDDGSTEDASSPKTKKTERGKQKTSEPTFTRQWIEGDFIFFADEQTYTAFPSAYEKEIKKLLLTLRPLSYGVQIAEKKGNDWIPSHALAMSLAYKRGTFPEAALSYEEALTYLRRESIQVAAPKGIVLVTYQGLPLGFVKNLGNRANNLYPQEWRIRSGYTTPFCITDLE